MYRATYNKIEQKIGFKYDIVKKIVTYTIKQAGYEDIYEVFAYVRDLNRSGQIPWVSDDTKLSQNIQNAILKNY